MKRYAIFVLLFISGCGYSEWPAYQYQPIQLYTPEHRLDNLERNAREAEIGKLFPNIAAKQSY